MVEKFNQYGKYDDIKVDAANEISIGVNDMRIFCYSAFT